MEEIQNNEIPTDFHEEMDDQDHSSIPGTMQRKKRPFKKAPDAPKRFKSAYICFVTDKMEDVKKSLPQDVKVTEVMKVLAYMWKNLPPLERLEYEKIARADKSRYMEELRNYNGPMQVPNKRQKKPADAPRRGMSAFLSYSQEMRPKIREMYPDMKNTDISSLLAQQWHAANEDDKRPHIEKELRQREKYYEDMAKWRADEEERKKESDNTPVVPTGPTNKIQLDFMDIGTASRSQTAAFWSKIEDKSGSYETNDTEATAIDRMNQYLSDAVELDQNTGDASVNEFWDHAFDQMDCSDIILPDGMLSHMRKNNNTSSKTAAVAASSSSNDSGKHRKSKKLESERDSLQRENSSRSSIGNASDERLSGLKRSRKKHRSSSDQLSSEATAVSGGTINSEVSSSSSNNHSSKRNSSSHSNYPHQQHAQSKQSSVFSNGGNQRSENTGKGMAPPPPAAYYFPLQFPMNAGADQAAAIPMNPSPTAQAGPEGLNAAMLPSYALGFYLAKLQQQLQLEQHLHHQQQQQQQARHDVEMHQQQQQIDQQQRMLRDLYVQHQHLLQRQPTLQEQANQYAADLFSLAQAQSLASASENNPSGSTANTVEANGGEWQRRFPFSSASLSSSTHSGSLSDKTSSESGSSANGSAQHAQGNNLRKMSPVNKDAGYTYNMDRFRQVAPSSLRNIESLRMTSDRYPSQKGSEQLAEGSSGAGKLVNSAESFYRVNNAQEGLDEEELRSIEKDRLERKEMDDRSFAQNVIMDSDVFANEEGGMDEQEIVTNCDSNTTDNNHIGGEDSQVPLVVNASKYLDIGRADAAKIPFSTSQQSQKAFPLPPLYGQIQHPFLFPQIHLIPQQLQFLSNPVSSTSSGAPFVLASYPVSSSSVASSHSSSQKLSSSTSSASVASGETSSRVTHALLNALPPPILYPPIEPLCNVESALSPVTPGSAVSVAIAPIALYPPPVVATSAIAAIAVVPETTTLPPLVGVKPAIVEDTNETNHQVLVNAPNVLRMILQAGFDATQLEEGSTMKDDKIETVSSKQSGDDANTAVDCTLEQQNTSSQSAASKSETDEEKEN